MPSALKSPMGEKSMSKPKKTRSVSIVVPGQRRSREQLYDHDDIILLDPTIGASQNDSNKKLQEKLPILPVELPPDINRHKLLDKSKSIAAVSHLPHVPLSAVDRTKSMGDIELPSMKRRTKPKALCNYWTKKVVEDRLVNTNIKVWCVCAFISHGQIVFQVQGLIVFSISTCA